MINEKIDDDVIRNNLHLAWIFISSIILASGIVIVALRLYGNVSFWGLSLTVWQMVGIPLGFMLGFLTGFTFMGKYLMSKTRL